MYDAPMTVPALLLACVLALSGVAKLTQLQTAEDAFVSLRLPRFLMRLKAPMVLPFAELVLAAALLVTSGALQLVVAICALLLFVAYLAIIVRALTFDEKVTCSCFGKLGLGSVDVFTAVRNVILVALAVVVVVDATDGKSVVSRLGDFTGAQWAWLAGVCAAIALTWLITGDRNQSSTGAVGSLVDNEGDYLRTPTPYATLTTADGQSVPMRELASAKPVLLLFVSPTCGPCVRVIDFARTWQKQVALVQTTLVIPSAPVALDQIAGLDNAENFSILFDPQMAALRMFQGGTPTAVLLGADGMLAGGPVSGTGPVEELMNDIAAELAENGVTDEAQSGEVDDAGVVTEAPARGHASGAASAPAEVPAQPVTHTPSDVVTPNQADASEQDDDYLRAPTPFALLKDGADAPVSLIHIADAGPVILLHVSPGCGPCRGVIDQVSAWQEQIPTVRIVLSVTADVSRDTLLAEGFEPNQLVLDEHDVLRQMMDLATPSLVAFGPDRKLLAGPALGSKEVEDTMADIIAEVRGLDLGEGTPYDETTEASEPLVEQPAQ